MAQNVAMAVDGRLRGLKTVAWPWPDGLMDSQILIQVLCIYLCVFYIFEFI